MFLTVSTLSLGWSPLDLIVIIPNATASLSPSKFSSYTVVKMRLPSSHCSCTLAFPSTGRACSVP